MADVPSPAGIGMKFANWGIPLIAGIFGFITGDTLAAREIVVDWVGGFLDTLPLADRIDYTAFATAGVYSLALGVVAGVGAALPEGAKKAMPIAVGLRTLKFYLVGVIGRMLFRGILPQRVTGAGTLAIPVPGGR